MTLAKEEGESQLGQYFHARPRSGRGNRGTALRRAGLRACGDRSRLALLAQGGKRNTVGLLRDFTGSDPDIRPLLAWLGLDTAVK